MCLIWRNVTQCSVGVFYVTISSFFYFKVAEPAHLSRHCETASFTVSNFGKEREFPSVAILVICWKGPPNGSAWRMVSGRRISPRVFFWVIHTFLIEFSHHNKIVPLKKPNRREGNSINVSKRLFTEWCVCRTGREVPQGGRNIMVVAMLQCRHNQNRPVWNSDF